MENQEEVKLKDTTSRDWLIAAVSGLGMLGFGAWGLKDNGSEIMRSFIAQAPGIFGVLLISRLFLTHMNRRENQYNLTILKISESCHEVHRRAINSIDKNTTMLGRSAQTIDQLDKQLGIKTKELMRKRKEVEQEQPIGRHDVGP